MRALHFIASFVSQSFFSSEDWTLGTPGGTTPGAIQANFKKWLSGSKNPGRIILEHELTDASVQSFIAAYPLIKQYNWNTQSVTTQFGGGPYSDGGTGLF